MAIAAHGLWPLLSVAQPDGWRVRLPPPSSFDVYASEALDAGQALCGGVRRPVEVPGGERVHMARWLSKRLGEDVVFLIFNRSD